MHTADIEEAEKGSTGIKKRLKWLHQSLELLVAYNSLDLLGDELYQILFQHLVKS
jgi:hypothetical protein